MGGDRGRAWKSDIYVFLYLDLGATPGSAWGILGRVLRKSLLAVLGTEIKTGVPLAKHKLQS